MLDLGQRAWAEQEPHVQNLFGYAFLGCGLLTEGERGVVDPALATHDERLVPEPPPSDRCTGWRDLWPATVVAHRTDVAVIVASQWDLRDWRLPGDGTWRRVGDPVLDAALAGAMGDAADLLHEAGASSVVFLTGSTLRSDEHADRARDYDRLLVDVAARRPFAQVVDFGAWVATLPAERAWELLPDGVHPTEATAARIWQAFLGPALDPIVAEISPRAERVAASGAER